MIAKDLIEILNKNPEAEVILQKDSEGNGYSPLAGADPDCVYIPDSTWSGEVYSMEMSAEEADMDDEEWEEIINKPKCFVLYPVN